MINPEVLPEVTQFLQRGSSSYTGIPAGDQVHTGENKGNLSHPNNSCATLSNAAF